MNKLAVPPRAKVKSEALAVRSPIPTIYIGIDPGKGGAIAFLSDMGPFHCMIFDFEDSESLAKLRAASKLRVRAVLEKVSAMPGQGVTSMFNFGANFGTWIGRLEALEIPFDFVTPGKWQKEMFDSMPAKGTDKKEMSRDRARRLFPQVADQLGRKKDHGRAEALLMAEYCRRMDK